MCVDFTFSSYLSYTLTGQESPTGGHIPFELHDDFHAEAICLANRYRLANRRDVLEDDPMDERLENGLRLPTIHDAGLWRVRVKVSPLNSKLSYS